MNTNKLLFNIDFKKNYGEILSKVNLVYLTAISEIYFNYGTTINGNRQKITDQLVVEYLIKTFELDNLPKRNEFEKLTDKEKNKVLDHHRHIIKRNRLKLRELGYRFVPDENSPGDNSYKEGYHLEGIDGIDGELFDQTRDEIQNKILALQSQRTEAKRQRERYIENLKKKYRK